MRIAYMLTSLGVGGAERQVLALAERMAARGHAVSLVVLRPRQPEEWPTTLDVFRLDMRKNPAALVGGLIRARRFMRAFKPDLIHSHTYPANLVGRLLHLFPPATPVISTIHNVYEGSWPRMLSYRLTDPLSCRTTAVSQAVALRYMLLKAVPPHKCSVLTNGIDTAEFTPNPERRVQIRVELGAGHDFIWLAAGRIAAAKDFPNLLRAFHQVRAAYSNAQLWIAGEATDAESMRVLDAFAAKSGSSDRVRHLGLRRDIPALLDAADAFVLSSAWEGMPLALGEAMAMEKPVVATDVGGVSELVGEAGRIVPSQSPDALAQAMLEIMRTPLATRQSLGRAARQRIATHFSIDAKANEWEALYMSLLALRP